MLQGGLVGRIVASGPDAVSAATEGADLVLLQVFAATLAMLDIRFTVYCSISLAGIIYVSSSATCQDADALYLPFQANMQCSFPNLP